jgi:hypothetical protein
MRLAALVAGAGVPAGNLSGRIAEVHARASLIALADGKFVTLVAAELGRMPRGITVDAPAEISLRALVTVGAAVASRGAILRLAGGGLAIDMRGARPWRCGLEALRLDIGKPSVARAYRAARAALDADGRSERLRQIAGVTVAKLADATRSRDVAVAAATISDLIGLGEGRTPAGDDYLVGYLAALWASGKASAAFAAAIAPRVLMLAAHTEYLSRHYLEAAAEGEVSERIAVVAAGIAAGSDGSTISRAVAAALAVGHSSGAAAVLGLLDGASACAETPCLAQQRDGVARRLAEAAGIDESRAARR